MRHGSNIWYSMKINEFYLILASLGVPRFYGFGAGKVPRSIEDVNRLIAGLWENQVISFSENKEMVLSDTYEKMFMALSKASSAVLSINAVNKLSTMISYVAGDEAVVTRCGEVDHGMIEMTEMPVSEWSGFLMIETVDHDSIIRGNSVISSESRFLPEIGSKTCQETAEEEGVLSVFDRVDTETGSTVERMTLREQGARQYITVERADSKELRTYSGGASEVKRIIEGWIV